MEPTTDTRERIVRTAAKLFLVSSYHAVGIADICAAANVRKGSFYHFFPSKSDLAKAVIDRHAAEIDRRLTAVLEGITGDGTGSAGARGKSTAGAGAAGAGRGLAAVAEVFTGVQQAFESRFGHVVGCPFGNLAAELATTDDGLREHLAAVFRCWEARLVEVCRRAAGAGELRPGVDPDRLGRTILAQAQGLILLAKVRRDGAAGIATGLHELISLNLVDNDLQGASHA